jgi:uncharacterized protein YjbI with pentapeptide repeats
MEADKLLNDYGHGQRDFRGAQLAWAELTWANLSGAIWTRLGYPTPI